MAFSPRLISAAFQATLPVILGYFPLGFAFGFLFVDQTGLSWVYAPLMSIVVFAGASQFLAVGLLAAGAGVIEIAAATFILNLRHVFFGVSLLERWRGAGLKKVFMIFWLTDETYALFTSVKPPSKEDETDFHLLISGINYSTWCGGSLAGAIAGQALAVDTTGLDFALTALFVVLLVEQVKQVRQPFPFVLALACGAVTLALFGGANMLLISIAAALTLLIADGARRGWA
ncbi:MAG: AzlC family ABC transporter permease [Rhodospirillales bacterium]|nr:AzlC family ABC transporter permease [Rhodospirillales bacterium]